MQIVERRIGRAGVLASSVSRKDPNDTKNSNQSQTNLHEHGGGNSPRFAAVPPGLHKVYFGAGKNWAEHVQESWDIKANKALAEEVDFGQYWDKALEKPAIVQNSNQRIYDMIMAAGTDVKKIDGRDVTTYNFFEKPENPENAIFGQEKLLDEFVQWARQASLGTKVGQRLAMFVGGPGSAKSTMVAMVKQGLDPWTKKTAGELYALKWVNLPEEFKAGSEYLDPLRGDPINVIPLEGRKGLEAEIAKVAKQKGMKYPIKLTGELSPPSRWIRNQLLKKYDYDLTKVIQNHVKAVRLTLSEDDRVGVGTFEARDSKGLDVTQLVGGVSFTKLADHKGDESHPLAYDFHTGELFVANRGIMEMIECLKLDQEFLYLLFSLAQERKVKADKMPLTSVDVTVFAHSNWPDYQNMINNPSLVALPSRMRIFKTPYPLDLESEARIYKKDYASHAKELGVHVAPHTLETVALWSVMSRLLEPEDGNMSSLVKRAKLYAGQEVKGYTINDVRKFKAQGAKKGEGLTGISVRDVQSILPMSLTNREVEKYKTVDGYLLLNLIEERMNNGFDEISEDDKKKYLNLLELATKDLDERLTEDVMEAMAGDVQRLKGVFKNYIDNMVAYCNNADIEDPHTFRSGPPNEKLMRSIEVKMGIDEAKKNDFRHGLMATIGTLTRESKEFTWESSPELRKAIVQKIFEDSKDSISLSILTSPQAGERQKEDMDTIVQRLLEKGYNEVSARNALARVRKLQNR